MPPVSLYINGLVEVVSPEGEVYSPDSLAGWYVVHVVDLLTEGSSVYRVESSQEQGWVPMLRQRGATVEDLLAVVSRRQRGEENLLRHGVTAHPMVTIDAAFLREHSSNPDRAVTYQTDPRGWSEQYLREHGALAFLDDFDPQGRNIDRARRFFERYETILQESRRGWTQFQAEIVERYGAHVDEIVGGK